MSQQGTVKWFNNAKGYGFIQTEEGAEDVFVHHTAIVAEGFRTLNQGERVNFELDGASVHGSPRQRETDLRRDAALAAQGILVVRFTHNRLVREPEAVRSEVLAILAAQRPAP